jgi:hypothetical protein
MLIIVMSLRLKQRLIKISLNKKEEIFKQAWEHNQGKDLNYRIIMMEEKEVHNKNMKHLKGEEVQLLQRVVNSINLIKKLELKVKEEKF